jgi:transposase
LISQSVIEEEEERRKKRVTELFKGNNSYGPRPYLMYIPYVYTLCIYVKHEGEEMKERNEE